MREPRVFIGGVSLGGLPPSALSRGRGYPASGYDSSIRCAKHCVFKGSAVAGLCFNPAPLQTRDSDARVKLAVYRS